MIDIFNDHIIEVVCLNKVYKVDGKIVAFECIRGKDLFSDTFELSVLDADSFKELYTSIENKEFCDFKISADDVLQCDEVETVEISNDTFRVLKDKKYSIKLNSLKFLEDLIALNFSDARVDVSGCGNFLDFDLAISDDSLTINLVTAVGDIVLVSHDDDGLEYHSYRYITSKESISGLNNVRVVDRVGGEVVVELTNTSLLDKLNTGLVIMPGVINSLMYYKTIADCTCYYYSQMERFLLKEPYLANDKHRRVYNNIVLTPLYDKRDLVELEKICKELYENFTAIRSGRGDSILEDISKKYKLEYINQRCIKKLMFKIENTSNDSELTLSLMDSMQGIEYSKRTVYNYVIYRHRVSIYYDNIRQTKNSNKVLIGGLSLIRTNLKEEFKW